MPRPFATVDRTRPRDTKPRRRLHRLHPDDYNAYNGVVRYTHGDRNDGFDLTAMAYRGTGNFTTDQPISAYQQGLISRFGTLDPSDGGRAERFSLSGHDYVSGDNWKVTTSAYIIHSQLTLWNDFTHFLVDPVQGEAAGRNPFHFWRPDCLPAVRHAVRFSDRNRIRADGSA
jgi:hypothetical protein